MTDIHNRSQPSPMDAVTKATQALAQAQETLKQAQKAHDGSRRREMEEERLKASGASNGALLAQQQLQSQQAAQVHGAANATGNKGVEALGEASRLQDSARRFLAGQQIHDSQPPPSVAPAKVEATEDTVRLAALMRQRDQQIKG